MFTLLPILDRMLALYEMPPGTARFQQYLSLLQGNRNGSLQVPIGNFNPMAKSFILEYIKQLQLFQAEKEMERFIQSLNLQVSEEVKVVLNIADDWKGGWTNRFTTDYTSRFGTSALLSRNFCTPIIWTTEAPELAKLLKATEQALRRFLYQKENGIPKSLREHVDQEFYVYKRSWLNTAISNELIQFFEKEAETNAYPTIFAFFYGDHATKALEMVTFRLGEGFLYYLNQ